MYTALIVIPPLRRNQLAPARPHRYIGSIADKRLD
jgi:hypothetical protein